MNRRGKRLTLGVTGRAAMPNSRKVGFDPVAMKGYAGMKRLLLISLLLNTLLVTERSWHVATVTAQDNKTLTAEQAEILSYFSVVTMEDGKGGTVKSIRLTGVNFQIVNGLGKTAGRPNGRGNIIVGYNEGEKGLDRTGSHNAILGVSHSYGSYGGLVVGSECTISGAFSSVLGGRGNMASGTLSSVCGGEGNKATGSWSSVSGGKNNEADGSWGSVGGGEDNVAGGAASVAGGQNNRATGSWSTITGGEENTASGSWSSISGGKGHKVTESWSWAADQ